MSYFTLQMMLVRLIHRLSYNHCPVAVLQYLYMLEFQYCRFGCYWKSLNAAEVDLEHEHIPEQRECVNELPQQGRVLLLLGKDRGLCGEAAWTPEAACGPVCEGVRNPHLFHQCKDVVILQVAKHFVVTPAIQRCFMST